jgi:FixJ family two-component response regulator
MTTSPVVLVVDDDGDIRAALELLLQYEGYTVWTARDGEEALARIDKEALAGQRPAAVLTDVKMPRLDGLGLLAKLMERASAPPVLMISGHGDIAMAVPATSWRSRWTRTACWSACSTRCASGGSSRRTAG